MKKIYKFSGAGNDFVVIDGREGDVSAFREVPRIEALCKEFKTDGLMILGPALRQAQGPVGELVEPQGPDLGWRLPQGLFLRYPHHKLQTRGYPGQGSMLCIPSQYTGQGYGWDQICLWKPANQS